MMVGLGWAKNPMLPRMNNLRADIPITLLYGSRSWIDQNSWSLLKETRSSVNVQAVNGAGHHVFADKPELFNSLVNEACFLADSYAEADISGMLRQKYAIVFPQHSSFLSDNAVESPPSKVPTRNVINATTDNVYPTNDNNIVGSS